MMKRTNLMFLVLLMMVSVVAMAQVTRYTFVKNFPNDMFKGSNGGHGIAVDPEGKVWFQAYGPTDSILVASTGKYAACRVVYCWKPDGTPASFSPIKTVTVGGVTDTLWNSSRGMRADANGNIVFCSFDTYYRLNYRTGAGMTKIVANANKTGIQPAFDSFNEMFAGLATPRGPIKIFDASGAYLGNLVDSARGYSLSLEVSPDGNDVFWAGYTNGAVYKYHSDNGSLGPYSKVDTIMKGLGVESITRNPKTGAYWASGGSVGSADMGYRNYKWYAFTPPNFNTPTDSLVWNGSITNDPRPRGMAFSPTGDTVYVIEFSEDMDSPIQMFTKPVMPSPIVATSPATNMATGSASLNGTVNANGVSTTAWFEWSTSSTLSSFNSTILQSIGSGTSAVAMTQTLTGLNANTVYYYRAVGQAGSAIVRGTIASFTTLALGVYTADENSILLLHMDEVTGTGISDASIFNSGATAVGTSIIGGRFGYARYFDGSSDYAEGLSSNMSFAGQNYTLEAWIKTSSTAGQAIFTTHNPSAATYSNTGLYIAGGAGGGFFDMDINNGQGTSASNWSGRKVNDGKWHHVAGVRYGSLITLYVDGKVDFQKSVTQEPNSSTIYRVGQSYPGSFFNGTIDEIRISNKARSPQEFNLQLPPTNLTATAVGTSINLSWQNGGGAVGLLRYKIYRGTDSTTVVLLDSTSATSYSNPGLQAGRRYYYRVSAVDQTGFEGAKSYASSSVALGLIAHYPFNGNANDASGNGNNGTISNATLTTDRFGNANAAYSFNGGLVQVPDSPTLDLSSSDFTISFWNTFSTLSYRQHLVAKDNGGGYNNKWVVVWECPGGSEPQGWSFHIENPLHIDAWLASCACVPVLNSWSHVLVTRQGQLYSIYLNGSFVSAQQSSIQIPVGITAPLSIGGSEGLTYSGKIDDVRIYSRALSTSEIDAIYHEGGWPPDNPGEYQSDANTALLLHINETTGSTAYDGSGHGSNGVAVGTSIVGGRFGYARYFNGSSDYAEGLSSNMSFAGQNYTLEACVKTSSTAGQAIFTAHNPSAGTYSNIGLYIAGGASGGFFDMDINNGQGTSASNLNGRKVNDGRWHHVAGVRYGSLITLYVDGKADFQKSVTQEPNSSTIYRVGQSYPGSFFNGTIDEIRISNKARSPQEFNLQLPPTNLTATAVGTSINLSWQNGGGAVGLLHYKIYRGTDSTNIALLDSTTSTSYSNTALAPGSRYFYRVSAVDLTGFEGAKSTAVAGIILFPGEYQPDGNTVLLLHINETSGSTVCDMSSLGNNGTAVGTAISVGRYGRARTFTGNLDAIDVNRAALKLSNFTIEAWIYLIAYSANPANFIVSNLHSGVDKGYFLALQPTQHLNFTLMGSPHLFSSSSLSAGKWYHVAATYDGLMMKLFVNGVLDASTSFSSLSYDLDNTYPCRIGNHNLNPNDPQNQFFNGTIDEVRMSNKARSPHEFNLQLPPINLTATPSGTTVNLSWQNGGGVIGLLRYKIFRGTDSTNVALIDSTTSTSYTNSGLTAGTKYFYRISAVDLTGFEGAKSYAASSVACGLVAYYPFNGNANDESGSGNDATVYGAVLTADRFGNSAKAYNFNGTSSYIQKNAATFSLSYDSRFTVSAWVKYSNKVGDQQIVSQSNATAGTFVWSLETNWTTGNINFGAAKQMTGWSLTNYPTASLQTGMWYHLVGVYDSASMRLYLNGALVATATFGYTNTISSSLPITIGLKEAPNYFCGDIDDVRIYNRSLSSADIDALYHEGGWPVSPPPSAILRCISPPTVTKGSDFNVEVRVDDSTRTASVFGVGFDVNFTNTSFVEFVSADTSSCFLGWNLLYILTPDDANGKVSIGLSRKAPASGVTGGGTVIKLKFHAAMSAPDNGTVIFSPSNISANDPSGTSIVLLPVMDTTTIAPSLVVWPGDADNSGLVNQGDILPIGVNWGRTGSPRSNASMQWVAQSATPWTPQAATYADANGDGVVNQADVLPIGLNWGKTHTMGKIGILAPDQTPALAASVLGTPVLRAVGPSSVTGKTNFDVNITLGDSSNVVSGLFGISFVLDFSTSNNAIQVLEATQGTLLGSDIIFFPQIDNNNGILSFGITRKAGQGGVNGSGQIAKVRFTILNQATSVTFLTRDIQANDPNGNPITIFPSSSSTLLPVEKVQEIPTSFYLAQNYPNPFNPSTRIAFSLPKSTRVQLRVLDLLGREVAVLVDGERMPGVYEVQWTAGNLPSGIYVCRFQAGEFVQMRKMSLIK